jgi:uncharacterized phage infection (PIP) family protein YhgE
MEKYLLQSTPLDERIQILRDSADKVEDVGYMKKFTPEEIADMKTNLSEVMIKLTAIEKELDTIKKSFKTQMKPLSKSVSELLENIHHKARMVNEEAYIRLEYSEGMAGYYNGEGELIYTRPLEAEERQTTIMQVLRKEGTNS